MHLIEVSQHSLSRFVLLQSSHLWNGSQRQTLLRKWSVSGTPTSAVEKRKHQSTFSTFLHLATQIRRHLDSQSRKNPSPILCVEVRKPVVYVAIDWSRGSGSLWLAITHFGLSPTKRVSTMDSIVIHFVHHYSMCIQCWPFNGLDTSPVGQDSIISRSRFGRCRTKSDQFRLGFVRQWSNSCL